MSKQSLRVQSVLSNCFSESTGSLKRKVDTTKNLRAKVAALGLAAFVSFNPAPSLAQTPSTSFTLEQSSTPSVRKMVLAQERSEYRLLRVSTDLRSAIYHNDRESIQIKKKEMHEAMNVLSKNASDLEKALPNSESLKNANKRLNERLQDLSKEVDASVHTIDQTSEIALTSLIAQVRGISYRIQTMFPDPSDDQESKVSLSDTNQNISNSYGR